ncbi:uncharacterized protein KGF55_004663 [Candida pseudojiufengensis]|uniref:uncharacterized protein n=1 Tax=Candida pseudojiufengensis TaxID=497109 RepID=UPI002224C142|nr:uncharacterized protein KGF55_004663 [Candida pseudojiufengensis]KAI5960371.1 hypothetical protein KGF55_004663 [Candida pseudojiufengensis]
MKFSHSLKFNSVPGWNDNYLKYPSLKKSIYKLQEDQLINNGNQNQGFSGNDKTTISEFIENLKIKNGIKSETIENSSSNTNNNENNNYNVKNRITKNFNFLQRFNKNHNINYNDSNNSSEVELHHIDLEKNEKTDLKSGETSITTVFSSQNSDQDIISYLINLSDEEIEETFGNPKSLKFDALFVFTRLLLIELIKINEFYQLKEQEIFAQYQNLIQDLKNNHIDLVHTYTIDPTLVENNSHNNHTSIDNNNLNIEFHDIEKNAGNIAVQEDTDDEDDEDFHSDHSDVLLDASHFNAKHQFKVAIKKRSISIFINLCELKSYIELNRQGFTKICKKFDKICGFTIKEDFVNNFLPLHSRVFKESTIIDINNKIEEIIKIYALFTNQLNSTTTKTKDLENVKQELRSHLRDHIVFERNTVWKDLLSLEKNSYNLNLDNSNIINKKMGDEGDIFDTMMHLKMKDIKLPEKLLGGKIIKIPEFLLKKQILKILLAIIAFVILISVKTFNDPVQGRALAVLVTCAILWATEALPLYATGLFVPLLVVTCKICKIEGTNQPMSAPDASKYILSTM